MKQPIASLACVALTMAALLISACTVPADSPPTRGLATTAEDRSAPIDDQEIERRLQVIQQGFEFDEAELEQVIIFCRLVTGVPIEVNWAALAAMEVTPATPVTIKLQNANTAIALREILASVSLQGSLGYVVYGGAVRIPNENAPDGI